MQLIVFFAGGPLFVNSFLSLLLNVIVVIMLLVLAHPGCSRYWTLQK